MQPQEERRGFAGVAYVDPEMHKERRSLRVQYAAWLRFYEYGHTPPVDTAPAQRDEQRREEVAA